MNILHLSDLHYSSGNKIDQKIVIDALIEDLTRLRTEENLTIDLIIFSGDLVMAGDIAADFVNAKTDFIDRVLECLGLNYTRFFIVPGNHDVAKSEVASPDYIEAGLSTTLNNVTAVNRFIDQSIKDTDYAREPLKRLDNFNTFIKSLSQLTPITESPFVETFSVNVDGVKVGIACLNSAWRANGGGGFSENRKLLIGERSVDVAVEDLQDADVRLAIFHHPVDWLTPFDQTSVESRLQSTFDILFMGHTHSPAPEMRTSPLGTCAISQAGALYESRDYFNGYQVLSFDVVTRRLRFTLREYANPPRRFNMALRVAPQKGQFEFTLKSKYASGSARNIEVFLRASRTVIREQANRHIAMAAGKDALAWDIKEFFICPPLASRPQQDEEARSIATESSIELSPEQILQQPENFIIFGDAKSGRTSIANFLAVRLSEGVWDKPRIPVIFDFSALRRGAEPLKRAFRAYYPDPPVEFDFEATLSAGGFLFFIDNVDLYAYDDKGHIVLSSRGRALNELIVKYPNCRWICTADSKNPLITNYKKLKEELASFQFIFIQALPRRSIRELSRRWSSIHGSDEDKLFNTLMRQIQWAGLPKSGYMISLLLWALTEERNLERLNEAVLLETLIEFLLDKADFTGALRREFDFRSKQILLQNLSVFLRSSEGFAEANDVLTFVIDFFKLKGLSYDASEVVTKLIDCGILDRVGTTICFKYRCFEEYFVADTLLEDKKRLMELFSDWQFIDYSREIELMSGLDRRDVELLNALSQKVTGFEKEQFAEQDLAVFPQITLNERASHLSSALIGEIRKEMSVDQIDNLMDLAEPRPARGRIGSQKASEELSIVTVFRFVNSLDLFGRVIRNMEFIDLPEKRRFVTVYLDKWCRMLTGIITMMVDEIRKLRKEGVTEAQKLTEPEIDALEYFGKLLFPTLLFSGAASGIASEKLAPIFVSIFNDPKAQLIEKIFCGFELLDLGYAEWSGTWEKLVDEASSSRFALQLLIVKLFAFYQTNPQKAPERRKLENLIVDIERHLTGAPRQAKGIMLQRLQKMSPGLDIAKE